uniref:M14 family zinc carboxypeptidase n=1 Tax=Streptomyces sp. NRRL S-87 TaxID=1463920 RepID=UPI0022773CD2
MCYPTARELALTARALVDEHPDLARLRQVGTSRGGRPLWLLSAGGREPGGCEVLVVAGAHANEPVGGPTALALARRVVREPALREHGGWHFLLCADPDGAALHRTPRPYTLLDYHRNFFRPPGPEQPEWAPALLAPDRLPPETVALTGLIDELRPLLQLSLHGTDLGGSWVQLTRDIPGLAEPFGKSAAELRIPVETSASDAAGWPSPGPGIFVMPDGTATTTATTTVPATITATTTAPTTATTTHATPTADAPA